MIDVRLRPWSIADASDLRDAWLGDHDLHRQFGAAELGTLDACVRFIAANFESATRHGEDFALVVDGRVVGNVGVSNVDHRHDTGWMYYWLVSAVRGRGLATLACATVAAWALGDFGLHRLELGARVNNPASRAVAARAGFSSEGVERDKLRYGSERFDVERFSRLASDAAPVVELLPLEVG